MNKLVIRFWDKIIVVLLGMTGMFTGCNKIKPDCDCVYYPPIERDTNEVVIMYGVLKADYVIRGTVMNQANLQPIPNIQISQQLSKNGYNPVDITTLRGKYSFFYYNQTDNLIHLKVEDIDGKENGGDFKTKEVKIKFTEDDKEKMEKCNRDGGTFVKIQNIELKKK
jgi:putative lipoprotein (rSAM/lipoprotein system)